MPLLQVQYLWPEIFLLLEVNAVCSLHDLFLSPSCEGRFRCRRRTRQQELQGCFTLQRSQDGTGLRHTFFFVSIGSQRGIFPFEIMVRRPGRVQSASWLRRGLQHAASSPDGRAGSRLYLHP
jgi:hypothetical protein